MGPTSTVIRTPSSSVARLGVFGGAFDPPHRAHVALAQAALNELMLDELRVFPTGQSWHKSQTSTAPEHRLAMARLAFGDLPRTVIDEREMRRPGPTYTIDTLRELKSQYPHASLFLVMGQDQAQSLGRWHEWQEILRMVTTCVAARPGTADSGAQGGWNLPEQATVHLLQLPSMSENATEIRERIAQSRRIDHLVPADVASYIAIHHLYEPF